MSNCLAVSNLSDRARESELQDLFSRHGQVLEVKITGENRSGSQKFGLVTMATSQEAKNAATALDQTLLHGLKIIVTLSDQPTPEEQDSSQSGRRKYGGSRKGSNPGGK